MVHYDCMYKHTRRLVTRPLHCQSQYEFTNALTLAVPNKTGTKLVRAHRHFVRKQEYSREHVARISETLGETCAEFWEQTLHSNFASADRCINPDRGEF